MKKVLFAITAATLIITPAQAQWSYGVLGIGFTRPYIDTESQSILVPAAMYEGERIIWRGPSLQYKVTGSQRDEPSIRVSLELAPNELEVESDELAGIEDRDFSVLAGLHYIYPTQYGQLSAVIQTDVTNRHNGQRAAVNFQRVLLQDERRQWAITAGAQLEYLTDNYANYYFGVSGSEAAASQFTAYKVDDIWQGGLTFGGYYQFNSHWRAILQARYIRLADELVDSPIIDDDYTVNGIMGITYQF